MFIIQCPILWFAKVCALPSARLSSYMFYTVKNSLGSNWPQRTPMGTSCVQDSENISCKCYVFPVVPNKLGKVMKYEFYKIMSIIYFETLNIEWGHIDPKGNRRVKPLQGALHMYWSEFGSPSGEINGLQSRAGVSASFARYKLRLKAVH